MNKEQRERKRRYRHLWKNSLNFHGLSYLVWLEEKLQSAQDERSRLGRIWADDKSRFEAFHQYIQDFETGMRIVERCARGTIGIETSIPSLSRKNYTEAVVAAVVSLYRVLDDAKKRFKEISNVEKEATKERYEKLMQDNAKWKAEWKAKNDTEGLNEVVS